MSIASETVPVRVPDGFAAIMSAQMQHEERDLATRWLVRLEQLIPVPAPAVFPSSELLDHIPTLIREIALYVVAADTDIAANTYVMAKARELGALRHAQRASAHQLMREYEILRQILHTFVLEETERLDLTPPAAEVLRFVRRVDQAIGMLAQVTVDTFIQAYSDTIEEQTARLERFNRFVSHELRQPLGVLHVATRMLRVADELADGAKREQAVAAIERNVAKLTELVDTITTLTRKRHAGTEELEVGTQRVELASVAGEAARQLRETADARQVVIRISSDLPAATLAVGSLELILMNLLSNAIKYSDPSKSERYVEVGLLPNDAACGFQIKDNGIGMNTEQLQQLFTPFYRGHTDAAEGLGLGLTIVRDCAESMGARVDVKSEPGEGTTVRVYWSPRTCAD